MYSCNIDSSERLPRELLIEDLLVQYLCGTNSIYSEKQ